MNYPETLEPGRTDELSEAIYHALNNPLSYVIANLVTSLRRLDASPEEAAEEKLLSELRDAMSEALDGTKRIQKTLTDLHRLSPSPNPEASGPTQLTSIIHDTLEILWNDIRHRAHVVRDFDDSIDIPVDGYIVGRTLRDIVKHATSCIPDGQASKRTIRMSTRRAGDRAELSICYESDLLKPLPEATCQTVDSFGGTVSTAVRHGNSIETLVTFPATHAVHTQEEEEPAPAPGSTCSMPSQVLIIDDDVLVARALQRLLEASFGIQDVSVSTHGSHAMEQLRQGDYGAVFCDVLMPDISGMEIFRSVLEERPDLADRFVFMSGSAFTESAREFLASVHNPYITKPFDEDHLQVLLRKLGSRLEDGEDPRILFVDANSPIRKSFKRSLDDDAPEVDMVSTREEALERFRSHSYAMAFVDYDLSGGAPSLIKQVRSEHPNTVFALTTTAREVQSVVDAVNLHHVSLIVHKPWDRAELNGLVRRGLRMHRQRVGVSSSRGARARSLDLLLAAVETSHPDVARHCQNVRSMVERLCDALQMSTSDRKSVLEAARFYDIGKIVIPTAIMDEDRPLSPSERSLVRAHVDLTDKMLSDVDVMPEARSISNQHHERWDGSGYPKGLKGTEITFGARILGVADSFAALLSDRPYRQASGVDEAIQIIVDGGGTLFDPVVVDAFQSISTHHWAPLGRWKAGVGQ